MAVTVIMTRYQIIDVVRGVAIVLMMAYHFSFDLNYFGVVDFDFYHDPFLLSSRALIVSLFLGLVGISLGLATANGLNKARYFRRLGLLIISAAAVSGASYLVYPQSMIFFGILHFISVASLLGLLFIRLYWANLIMGVLLIVTGLTFQHPVFDYPALQWLGLVTHKPFTEDYVPLIPWFGVVLIGLFLNKLLFNGPAPKSESAPESSLATWSDDRLIARILAFGGRHSLLIYLFHQPVFFAILYLSFGL